MKPYQKNSIIAGIILCIAPSFAQASCYTPEQARAEHLLRLHSELMVVATTCRQGSDGSDLSAAYVSFTRKNLRALRGAEKTMLAYYKYAASGDPVENLDRLRTRLGNEAGQTAADMSAPTFCARYRDDIEKFRAATAAAIDKQIQQMAAASPSFVKPCGK
ncbi:MAG: hypothetical protein WC464_07650 [Bdellovibrionales bacterium]